MQFNKELTLSITARYYLLFKESAEEVFHNNRRFLITVETGCCFN